MRFKGNEPVPETSQPMPGQPQPRDRKNDDEHLGTLEAVTKDEDRQADEANVEEIEQTSIDYSGRRSQETDGAVPAEPPDNDPLAQAHPRKPKTPPAHNM
jgi:hypothetical protein